MSAAIALSGTQAAVFLLGVISGAGYLRVLAHWAVTTAKIGYFLMPPILQAIVGIPPTVMRHLGIL